MHKNQIYANKSSFKVPFSYLPKTELHAPVFNSSYIYSPKSTKTIFLVNMLLWVYYETIVVDIPSSDQGDLISSE